MDRLILKNGVEERLTESVETALLMGNGSLIASLNDDQDLLFSEALSCKSCDISFPTLTPQSFSFNSPQGMCQKCNGLGTEVTFDKDLVIPDGNLTLREGALKPVGRIDTDRKSMRAIFYFQVFDELRVPLDKKWKDFSKKGSK